MSLTLRVRGPDGQRSLQVSAEQPVWIGRGQECELVIDWRGVSRKHVALQPDQDGILVTDASTNGTKVDGLLLTKAARLSTWQPTRLQLAGWTIEAWKTKEQENSEAESAAVPSPQGAPSPQAESSPQASPEPMPEPPLAGGPDVETRREIHQKLLANLDLQALDRRALKDAHMRPKVIAALRRVIAEMPADRLRSTTPEETEKLVQELTDEALGLGPLESLLADADVSEIMVVDPHTIYVERGGKMELSPLRFTDDDRVRAVIERIVTPLGRRIDESTPLVDARLKDGSRVNAVIPPLALRGPCITIRKFRKDPLRMNDLVGFDSVSQDMARFLENCVRVRRNVVISGGTGSGKTTLLNVLSAAIPSQERVVTVEDAAELQLAQPHVVSLESRPPNLEGKGEYTIRDLVKNALRMRPDRIVVGECRGGEALDMLQAMNTGHEGSLTTTHANSPTEAVARLETLCLMAGLDLPMRAIRQQIASSIHVIIQQTRFSDGSRRVQSIAEVTGIDDRGEIELQEIFRFNEKTEEFVATGFIPSFIDRFLDAKLLEEGAA